MQPGAMNNPTTHPAPPTSELLVRGLYWLLLLSCLGALASAAFEGWQADLLLWPVTLASLAFALLVAPGGRLIDDNGDAVNP